jgi:two-component system phosphate regulon sensor histidine kinase PhoR
MNKLKNSTPLLLMLSSIVLLLILEFFWLQSNYDKAVADFNKETNALFRTTLFSIRDSLFQRRVETISLDSANGLKGPNSMPIDFGPPDSTIVMYMKGRAAKIEIFVSGRKDDSLNNVLAPVVTRIQREGVPIRDIISRPDTVTAEHIRTQFQHVMTRAGYSDMEFVVTHSIDTVQNFRRRGGFDVTSNVVRIFYPHSYAISFPTIGNFAWRTITPQILFSAVLTLLTIGAFLVMFKSLRLQQRLMELKNDFISNLTHELKTPIATVSVALEALKNFKGLSNPKLTEEYLDIAQNELGRLTIMTDKVLKTAIFEKHGVDFQTEKVDLEKITSQVLQSMKLLFEKNQTKVSFDKEGTDFTLEGGTDHLTNVIYNLIDNALKYKSKASEITIKLIEQANNVILSIRDNGIGIDPEYKDKIFEKFFRVPSGNVHNAKGYGLGLSYVNNVVKSHHGTIEVDSTLGLGSNFIIELPKKQP